MQQPCRMLGLQRYQISRMSTSSNMARTYSDAIASLNSLQTNFAIVDAIRKSGRKMNEQAIPEMVEWCRKIGYQVCFK